MSSIQDIVTKTESKIAKDAKITLIEFVDKINLQLEAYFDKEISNVFGVSNKQRKLSKHILEHIKEHNMRPCKRLRGSFVYYGYKLLGGKNTKEILKTSMCAELIQTALLIHDDFMDQDDVRRYKPTTHKYYQSIHNNNYKYGDPIHYGDSMAVDAGDVALMLGFEILSNSKFDSSLKTKAMSSYLRGIGNTALGQAYDITLEARGSMDEQDVLDLHHAKTAIYTYINPLQTGAILAGANEDDLSIINEYATFGGIAFQIQDDVLGLFGDSNKTGKSAHADLKEGKVTLLTIYSFNNGTAKQIKMLKKIWGNKDITESDAEIARKIIIDTGALEHSKQISIKYAKKAQRVIPKMKKKGWNYQAINYLDGIAQYMIERDL
ncbi:polyprenyl synthetase family protein [Candidatus Woesebacteria bacterium]|nr:MAG: polyprenyl synthetase family protein [Candidatus Woesebacteria bacterium]